MTLIVSLLSVVLCFTLKSKLVGGFSIPKATDSSPTSLPKNCLRFNIRLNAIAVEFTPEKRKSGNSTNEVCIVTNNDDDDDDDNDNDNGWDLRQDWALQDAVPRYTVGRTMISSSEASLGATFWTQLRHSTPALATNTETDLEKRYSVLQQRQQQQLEKTKSSATTNDIQVPKLIQSGSSPTLLSDWWISASSSSASSITSPTSSMISTTMISGILESGSKIWFPLQCAGTVGDQPITSDSISQDTLDDFFISSSMTLHTSSYAISMGGMVYELGKPQRQQQQQQIILGESHDSTNSIGTGDHDTIILINQLKKMTNATTSIITKNAGMFLSIIAASTISACITAGYVTAIKTTADNTAYTRNANQNQIVAITKSSSSSTSAAKYTRGTTENRGTVPQYTVSEQRARQELRVGRDKRHMVLLQDKLDRDEVKLTELRQEESSSLEAE